MRAKINGKKNSAWVTVALCLALAVLGVLHFGGIGTKWLTLLAGIGVIALLVLGDRKRIWNLPSLLLLGYAAFSWVTIFWAMSGKFHLREGSKILIAVFFFLLVAMHGRFDGAFMRRVMGVIAGISALYAFLSVDTGFINKVLIPLFGQDNVIVFYQEKKYWPFILTFVHLWKGLGFSTVVYLASIVGISPELYEAARMDGASKWQQIKNVTLPNLVPTAITLFILSVGKIFFSDFGLFYQVPRNSGMLFSATQTIDTYVYNALMVNNNIALSSAASVLQSLCGVVCILLANWVVRKISEENAMF